MMEKISSIIFKAADKFSGHKQEITDLKMENDNYKNGFLYTKNELLKDEIKGKDNLLFKTTQENSYLIDKVVELELEHEKDLIHKTKLTEILENVDYQKNIYKEVINEMCDKFGIDHSEVFNIIDSIKERDNKNEMER